MHKNWKRVFSFLISLVLVLITFLGISETYVKIHKAIFTESDLAAIQVALVMGFLSTLVIATLTLAREIRSNPQAISIGTTNLPNFLYHPDFEKQYSRQDEKLLEENRNLENRLDKNEEYAEELLDELEMKDFELEQIAYISDIFIRHHKNASRLVRSLIQLLDEGKNRWKWEFCNNVLDECVTVLLEDRADKSSTIYFIKDNQLDMFTYNRIEFSSSRERKFRKGEGFAGHIWDTGEAELVSDVNESAYFEGHYAPQHEYGSILGVPIKVGKEIVGVLCVQSENVEEFQEDDIRTVIFYADMCALAHFYDKIKER